MVSVGAPVAEKRMKKKTPTRAGVPGRASNGSPTAPRVTISAQQSELKRALVLALAPVLVAECMHAGDAWESYEDLAGTLWLAAEVLSAPPMKVAK